MAKSRIVQIRNPRSGHYIKIDREEGRIIGQKKSDSRPYRNIPVMRKRRE